MIIGPNVYVYVRPYQPVVYRWAVMIIICLTSFSAAVAQSSNCDCQNSLLVNGSFEGGSVTGWTFDGAIQTQLPSGYDDCGNTSVRLKKTGPPQDDRG